MAEAPPEQIEAAAMAAELTKLTKAELVDRVIEQTMQRREGPRASRSPEASFAIQALVDLHRASAHEGNPGRYLEAAKHLGDELANSILGPDEGAAR